MKLVMAIVQKHYTDEVLDALNGAGFRATRLASTGGFLREGNTTLIIGTEDAQVDPLLQLLQNAVARAAGTVATTPGVPSGRGAAFVLPLVDSFQL